MTTTYHVGDYVWVWGRLRGERIAVQVTKVFKAYAGAYGLVVRLIDHKTRRGVHYFGTKNVLTSDVLGRVV